MTTVSPANYRPLSNGQKIASDSSQEKPAHVSDQKINKTSENSEMTRVESPKIITQIEASVLVTQTVGSDGTVVQFPKQGVVDAYRKTQQEMASLNHQEVLDGEKDKV